MRLALCSNLSHISARHGIDTSEQLVPKLLGEIDPPRKGFVEDMQSRLEAEKQLEPEGRRVLEFHSLKAPTRLLSRRRNVIVCH
jgi:hypothetical protein